MSTGPGAYLTVTDLTARGWTRDMVADLLGREDESRPNPKSPRRPVRLYLAARVAAAETTAAFTRRAHRSPAQAAAARRDLAAALDRLPILVPVLTRDALTDACGSGDPDTAVSWLAGTLPLTDWTAPLVAGHGRAAVTRDLRARVSRVITAAYPDLAAAAAGWAGLPSPTDPRGDAAAAAVREDTPRPPDPDTPVPGTAPVVETRRLVVRVDRRLFARVVHAAKAEGLTVSDYVAGVLDGTVPRHDPGGRR